MLFREHLERVLHEVARAAHVLEPLARDVELDRRLAQVLRRFGGLRLDREQGALHAFHLDLILRRVAVQVLDLVRESYQLSVFEMLSCSSSRA